MDLGIPKIGRIHCPPIVGHIFQTLVEEAWGVIFREDTALELGHSSTVVCTCDPCLGAAQILQTKVFE